MSDKPSARLESGTSVYRASAAGHCIRALVASRLGYEPLPPPERMQVIFSEGHLHEPAIIEKLREDGWDVQATDEHGRQIAVEVPVSKSILIEGHIDGQTTDRVVECKALSQSSFEKWDRHGFDEWESYAVQITIYMAALGKKALYAVKNRNTGQVDVRLIDDAPRDINEIKAKILRAESYARRGELPDCDTSRNWLCDFKYLEEDRPDELAVDDVLDALAATYAQAREREKEAAAAKNDAKQRLDEHLGESEKVETTKYKVTRYQSSRKKLDTEKLRAELGDETIDQYEIQTVSVGMRVTSKERDEKV